jgi:hypothetical protein
MKSYCGNYYIGTIVEVTDPDLYQVKIDIPGVTKDAPALPFRGEVDEPKPGNVVLVRCLDPVFGSVYLYSKLKENDFIGFRSRGKMVDITEDYIRAGIFADKDYKDQERPELTSWAKLDKGGNIEVHAEGDVTVTIDGKADITVTGDCTITAPNVNITGGNLQTVNGGTCAPAGIGGFCAVPVCPMTGAPHVGNKIQGT